MAGPYDSEVVPLDSIMKYIKKDTDGVWYFIGKTLEVRIPKRFSVYNCLDVGDEVQTLGIMDLIVDGKYQFPLNFLGIITIIPSEITNMTYNGVPYLVLHLQTNDVFLKTHDVIKNDNVIFATWSDFINYGNQPYWLSYRGVGQLYTDVVAVTGSGIGVGRSVYEVAVAFVARSQKNPLQPYRLTDMKDDPNWVALRSVSLARTGTMSRLAGAYFDIALTASLRYSVDTVQPFEKILQGVSAMTSSQRETKEAA